MLGRACGRCRPRALRHLCSKSAGDWEYDADVLVVGGGIVGATLAALVAQSHGGKGILRVALAEGRAPPPLEVVLGKATPDARVYALTPFSRNLLDLVGVWPRIEPRAHPFKDMQVWDSCGHGFMRFSAEEAGSLQLGHIAEHGCIQSALFERLQELHSEGSLELLSGMTLDTISFDGGVDQSSSASTFISPPACTIFKDEKGSTRELKARLIIAADGAASRVRSLRGMSTWGWGYDQRAVVATVSMSAPHSTAWQRFLPSGPVALLPLSGSFSSLVWSTTPQEADALRALPESEFIERLNDSLQRPSSMPNVVEGVPGWMQPALQAASGITRAITSLSGSLAASGSNEAFAYPPLVTGVCSPRFSFDLNMRQASNYTAPRIALAGDAAHTIHPMAGQGLNLGLKDIASLAQIIDRGLATGSDLGSSVLLRKYEAARKPDNLAMAAGMEILNRMFGTTSAPFSLVRNAGMSFIHAASPARKLIAQIAMGNFYSSPTPNSQQQEEQSRAQG